MKGKNALPQSRKIFSKRGLDVQRLDRPKLAFKV